MPSPSNDPLDSSPAPKLTVVIVNFNGWDDVARLADSLGRSPEVTAGVCEVVVVDNASDGPIPASFESSPPNVHLVLRPENGGFAAGVNAGFRRSRAEWLLLLNPDVEVGDDFLRRVLARIAHHEGRPDGPPGAIGFALTNPDGSRQPSVGAEPGLFRALAAQFLPRSRRNYQSSWRTRPGPVPWVTGACLLVEMRLMRSLGGMDEEFFLYYEEVALCRSARARGRAVEFDDAVSIVHLRPLQNRPISPKMRVIIRHAKLLFFRKFQPRWQFWMLSWIVVLEALLRGWLAMRRGDTESRGAWRAIGGLARNMRLGHAVIGCDVLAMAEAATGEVPKPWLRGPLGRRRDASASGGGRPA